MPILAEASGAAVRLRVSGDMTIYQAAELKDELLQAVAGHPEVELDLSEVSDLDTAGFQLLVLAKREAAKAGAALHLAGRSDPVQEVLALYRMESYFGDSVVLPAG